MIRKPLENVDGELYIDGVSALKLAEEFGTPLYVISENKIRENYRRLKSAFSSHYYKVRILYSAKANTNISVLKILKSEGAWIDTVSAGEVYLALEAGFQPEQIFYTGINAGDEELGYIIEKRVKVNLDSLSQLKRLLKIGVPSVLSMRINTEFGAGHHEYVVTAGKTTKFGVQKETALKAYELAKEAGVEKFGIHMHIGSGIMDVNPYIQAVETLLKTAKRIREELKLKFDFMNFGGGFGVPYKPNEEEIDLQSFSDKLVGLFKRRTTEYLLGEPELWFEPGRYIVSEAGILLTRVNAVKQTFNRGFVGVDAGFHTLIRPVMYGSYHHILVANKLNMLPTEKYDVVGPLCESGDILAKEHVLPSISEGDLLAILNAGAYGFSMSSQYNSRPRPAEVLVKDGHYALVRERETFLDLIKGQRIAEWLEY
ncbi:MAG: diaminopimelate decarboxylase [Candidatus Bathycorpusculaceae bacterium]